MSAFLPEQPRSQQTIPEHLAYWGQIASHPERYGVALDSEEAPLLGHEALKQYFLAQDSEQAARIVMFGSPVLEAVGTEIYGSRAALTYKTIDNWYRALGPTNAIRSAQHMLVGAGDLLRHEAESKPRNVDQLLTLAGDLYHEAALQCGPTENALFMGLCADAQECYRAVVRTGTEGGSVLGELAAAGTQALPETDVRAIARATSRYHDLKFLRARPEMQAVLDGDELSASGQSLVVECLRMAQVEAWQDFRYMVELSQRKGSDGKPLVPIGLLQDQFVVLATRNELLTTNPLNWEINRMLAVHVRNAFPREAAPNLEVPKRLVSFKANVVCETFDRTGLRVGSVYYRTSVDESERLSSDVRPLPPIGRSRRVLNRELNVPNMMQWSNYMRGAVDVAPSNLGVRARIRQAIHNKPLPFDVSKIELAGQ